MPDEAILRNIDGNLRFVIKVTDVASLEEDLSDRIRDKMKTRIQSILLLGNDKQKVVTDGYPYLREDCIHSRAVEGLDVEMLLDPLEEDLNLPPFTVEFGDGNRLQSEVVGQKPIDCTIPKVLIDNKSEIVRVLPGSVVSCKPDCLIGDKAGLRINFPAIHNLILHVVFGPSNEPRMRLMEMGVERIKLDIAFIHEIVSVGFYRNFLKYLGIMNRDLCKAYERWNRAIQVHQSVHLEAAFSVMKRSPRAERKTQLNGAAVESTNHFVKINSQLLTGIKLLRLLYQDIAKVLINTPITLLVRFCKGRFGHYLQARSIQVLRTKVKRGLNIPQTASVCELSKAHHKELVPAIELDSVPVAFVAIHTLAEFIFGEERHKLCEDCFALVHGLREAAQMPLRKLTSSNRKIIFAL